MKNTNIEKMTKEELIAKLQGIVTKMREKEDDADGDVREMYEEAQDLIDNYFEGIGWSAADIGCDEVAYVDWENGKELREFDDDDDYRAEDTVLDGIITDFDEYMEFYKSYHKKLKAIIETIVEWEVQTFYAVLSSTNWQTTVYTADDYDRIYC